MNASTTCSASETVKQRLAKFWVLIPVVLLLGSGVAAWQILQAEPKEVAQASEAVSCTGDQAANFSCWQQRYNTIVADQSPAAAFKDLRKNYATNAYVKIQCHQIAHVIGRAAAKKYTTLTETYAHGDNFCTSGYYHGAIETIAAQLGPQNILTKINQVCAALRKDKPYGLDHYNCVHGMGHGLMAVQDDNLFKALDSCDRFDGDWQQQACYGGVFMENVMNEINPGEHSNYLKKDDPLYPCTAVADKYKKSCYLMQTGHALLVENYDYAKVFNLCSSVEAPFSTACYQSLGRDVSGVTVSDQAKTIKLCMLGPTAQARENCFTGAVKDFIYYFHSDKQGLALCAAIPDIQLADSCRLQAIDYYRTF